MSECYMCEKESTTTEHAPPKCIFPESKDLPDGVDLRKQLITVPACDDHNLSKSNDDEYFLYVLTMTVPSNEVGIGHFLTKVLRSITRRNALITNILEGHETVLISDSETGTLKKTIAVTIDNDRVVRIIEMMVRALFYNHFGEKWLEEVSIQTDFLIFTDDAEGNRAILEFSKASDKFFDGFEFYGENPEVFKYQIAKVNGSENSFAMKLYFYGNCKITALLG